ncbi:MAG: glycosyltransferase [Flavobacteriales bacterium]
MIFFDKNRTKGKGRVKEIQEFLMLAKGYIHVDEWNSFDKIALLIFFGICIYIVWIYSLLFTKKMLVYSDKNKKGNSNVGISVIVAAKNEAENLKKYLPYVLEQDYNNFEVIVVNDGSWDQTQNVLEAFEIQYPHLKLCRTYDDEHQSHFSGKKLALTIGIKAAKYDQLLFTDADCMPISKHWIRNASQYIVKDDLTVLLGSYMKTNGLLNACIRFETLKIALTYAGFAAQNNAYMSVGRNFAYKKSTFFDVNGFSKYLYVPSGDDDLFIQECKKANKSVGVLFSKSTKTVSEPKETFKQWYRQKRRHVSTSSYYPKQTLIKLFVLEILQILFFIGCPILLLFINIPFILTYSIFFVILGFVLFRWYRLLKLIDEKINVFLIPFYSVLVFLFQGIVGISNMINKPKNWMGV